MSDCSGNCDKDCNTTVAAVLLKFGYEDESQLWDEYVVPVATAVDSAVQDVFKRQNTVMDNKLLLGEATEDEVSVIRSLASQSLTTEFAALASIFAKKAGLDLAEFMFACGDAWERSSEEKAALAELDAEKSKPIGKKHKSSAMH